MSGGIATNQPDGSDDRTIRQAIDDLRLVMEDVRDALMTLRDSFQYLSTPVTISNPAPVPLPVTAPLPLLVAGFPAVQAVSEAEGLSDGYVRRLLEDIKVGIELLVAREIVNDNNDGRVLSVGGVG